MIITLAVALLFAAPQAAPQTPPPASADITSSLNSGPPRPAEYLAPPPTPAPTSEAETPPAARAPAPAVRPSTPPASQPPARTSPAAAPTSAPARPATVPARPASTPTSPPAATSAPTSAPAPAPTPTPAPTPAPEAAEPPPPPSVPAVTVLDSAARAALPFRVDLPAGFELVTGRPGPDFRIYTVRRGDRSFAMIYAGPASQFPIYSGEVLEAGGRATVVSTEDGVRYAREHLFQRPEGTTPREIHVWTMSLEGADRALAERIAQTVDPR